MKDVWIPGAVLAALALAAPARAQKAAPSVEFTDPTGDVNTNNNGPENARDVIKLSLGSDGTNVLVTATLAQDEQSTMAGGVLGLYLDTDNAAATGGKTRYGQGGFEYEGGLYVCHGDGERIHACAGGGDGKPPKARYAQATLERFTGKPGEEIRKYMTTQTVSSGMGLPSGPPLKSRVLAIKLPYADIGAKSGQVVRLLAFETDANDEGSFPEARLALK